MCVAAYVAMFTGIGLSIEAAAWVRTSIVGICTALLVWLVLGALRTWLVHSIRHSIQSSQGI